MKAHHIHLMRTTQSDWVADPATLIHRRKFELLTHMYSCINHKTKNPDIPLTLITDESTLAYYDLWQLTGLYDDVITDFHDDYPHDRVSKRFWSSPKIWAMHKLQAPFVIFDTDTVIHKPLSTYTDCDLLYLHRETPNMYPNPLDIAGPPGFKWDEGMLRSFRGTLPMNCAVVGMFNEAFKRDYVERYFEFVLDAPGDMLFENQNIYKDDQWASAQMIAEQWLVAALAHKWNNIDNKPLRTRALVKALWTSEDFSPLDMDQEPSTIQAELSGNFYRLWGAKQIQNDPADEHYDLVRNTLLGGRSIVEESPQYSIVKDVYEQIIVGLTDDHGTTQYRDDLKTIFDSIYESGVWGKDGNNEGTSGSGSSFGNSETYFNYLQDFLKDKKIGSVVDAGCGDWQFSKFIEWGDISYVGYDASRMVIEKNVEAYANDNILFVHENFLTSDLPAAELLIVKDVLQHLSIHNIHEAMKQFYKFKYVIVVNDIDPVTLSALNLDIRDGGYRTLDITSEPFNVEGATVLSYQTPHSGEMKQVLLIENPNLDIGKN